VACQFEVSEVGLDRIFKGQGRLFTQNYDCVKNRCRWFLAYKPKFIWQIDLFVNNV